LNPPPLQPFTQAHLTLDVADVVNFADIADMADTLAEVALCSDVLKY
jgi:hypothetical protein